MNPTEGPVPASTPDVNRDVKTLLRRPFRLNLPAGTSAGSLSNATGPPSPPAPGNGDVAGHIRPAASASATSLPAAPAAKPVPPARPAPTARTTTPLRRPLTNGPTDLDAAGHQSERDASRASRPAATLNQAQILDATAACLAEEGYDGTTIRKIARRLDCAVGSIYRYFTDKRELLDAVVQRRFLPVAEAVEARVDPDITAQQYAVAAASGPEQYRLMFWLAAVGRAPDQPAALPAVIQRILDGWTDQLGDANAARCRWALLHGQVTLGLELDCEPLPDGITAAATS